jgi:hypothetical protein
MNPRTRIAAVVANSSASARTSARSWTTVLDYSLKRWAALTRYLDDGAMPIDNNWVGNQIRPWALGRNNWLFAASLRSGQHAAAVMSLIQSCLVVGCGRLIWTQGTIYRK